MRYLCLAFVDERKWSAMSTAEQDAFFGECRFHEEELSNSGRVIVMEPLRPAEPDEAVRVRKGSLLTADSPCTRKTAQLGGFYLIDAGDLNDAIRLASRMPPARLGYIEVRPVRELREPQGRITNGEAPVRWTGIDNQRRREMTAIAAEREVPAVTARASAPEFSIARTFDAPRDLVWKAHTEAERMAQWWKCPEGSPSRIVRLDARPGGVFHYCMVLAGGAEMWGRFVYRAVAAPEKLVFVSSFSDAEGGVTRAPFSTDWPLEILNTCTMTEQDGKTTVQVTSVPLDGSEAELRNFEAMLDSLRMGYSGTFNYLDEYLARA